MVWGCILSCEPRESVGRVSRRETARSDLHFNSGYRVNADSGRAERILRGLVAIGQGEGTDGGEVFWEQAGKPGGGWLVGLSDSTPRRPSSPVLREVGESFGTHWVPGILWYPGSRWRCKVWAGWRSKCGRRRHTDGIYSGGRR